MISNLSTGPKTLAATSAGDIPDTNTSVIQSVNFGTPIQGGGDGNAPGLVVAVDLASAIIDDISSITVRLRGEDGSIHSVTANASNGDDLESFFFELSSEAVSGTYEISSIQVNFLGDPEVTGYPQNGVTFSSDEISSLMPTRFIELTNPDEDRTPPVITDIELPTRSIIIDNDLPDFLGGGESVEITFNATITDDNSGLNVIEFEFDIGPNSPAVIGASLGIFGDLEEGEKRLSTFNTEAPAGTYVFELFRVSDDQNNTTIYSADDLASLGYQNMVHVVTRDDLQDAESPTVNSFSLASNAVSIEANGGTLDVTLDAEDTGVDATGVQTITMVLTNASGSRYQLEAEVTFTSGTNATATFSFPPDFPGGEFTIERLSVNDAAYNRDDIALDDMTLIIDNPFGGDVTNNRLRGDDNDNLIVGRMGADTLTGGDGNDTLYLGDGDDIAWAGADDTGDDTVVGGSGNDIIAGGAGDDLMIGGQLLTYDIQTLTFRDLEERLDGSDTMYGGAGDDTIYGGSPWVGTDKNLDSEDSDYGSISADVIYSGTGEDWIQGSYGADTIGGGAGDDTIKGGAGNDVLYGGVGDANAQGVNDIISGEDGDDIIFASGGDDSVKGGADNDALFGGAGNDTVIGDGGHDEIYGGAGDDVLTGGTGKDTFFFAPGNGNDVITDFDVDDDTLVLRAYSDRFASLSDLLDTGILSQVNGETGMLFDFGNGDSLFIAGIDNYDFLFDIEF